MPRVPELEPGCGRMCLHWRQPKLTSPTSRKETASLSSGVESLFSCATGMSSAFLLRCLSLLNLKLRLRRRSEDEISQAVAVDVSTLRDVQVRVCVDPESCCKIFFPDKM